MIIQVKDVSKSFGSKNSERTVFDKLNFSIRDDEIVSIVGVNGSGKTTLLRMLAGLEFPDCGSISFPSGFTGGITGLVWQNYADSLLPWYSIKKNILLPVPKPLRKKKWDKLKDIFKKFFPTISECQKVCTLSGGQKQIVALVRSIAVDPDIFLLDEPFSALDQFRSWKAAEILSEVWNERRRPVLLVSHDIDEAVFLADKILCISKSSKNVSLVIENNIPHPRQISSIKSEEHISCRNRAFNFLEQENVNG